MLEDKVSRRGAEDAELFSWIKGQPFEHYSHKPM